jgi:Family of unknown function (DUF6868)
MAEFRTVTDLGTLTTFLGWCTGINLGLIILMFLMIWAFHDGADRIIARVFGVSEGEARSALLRVFFLYRSLWAMFNLVPFIALLAMGEG